VRAFGRFWVIAIVALLGLAAGAGLVPNRLAASAPPPVMYVHAPATAPAPLASPRASVVQPAVSLGVAGIAPEMTSLAWTPASPGFGYWFSSYELDYSYDDVTWTEYKNITNQSVTQLGYLWCPGCAFYWVEFTWDSSPVGNYIEGSGQLLPLTQPLNATSSFVWSNDSSVWVDWTNPASYGGNVSFVGYGLWESQNGSPYALDAFINDPSQRSEFVSGLAPDTTYSFYVATWDHLSDSFLGGDYETNSTQTSFVTPGLLTATATVNRSAADVGQSLGFGCTPEGGLAPFTYGWAFGDGGTALGSSASYAYSLPGTYTATCAAFDSADSVANSGVGVTISADPTVAAPTSSSPSVLEGKAVTFNVSSTAGSGGLTYSWTGLPPGCSSADAATLSCTPSASGNFTIVVTVTDSNGGSAQSAPLTFKVQPAFLGLPAAQGYWLAGGIAAVGAGALGILLLLRRKKKGRGPRPEPLAPQVVNPPPAPAEPPSSPSTEPPPGASQ
jgi:hypothetical protein